MVVATRAEAILLIDCKEGGPEWSFVSARSEHRLREAATTETEPILHKLSLSVLKRLLERYVTSDEGIYAERAGQRICDSSEFLRVTTRRVAQFCNFWKVCFEEPREEHCN